MVVCVEEEDYETDKDTMCGEVEKFCHRACPVRAKRGSDKVGVPQVTMCRSSKVSPFMAVRELREAREPKEGRTIFFSRHGESEYNVEERIGGDPELTDRGRRYAKAMGSYINSLGLPNLKIWTSSLRRTISTAAFTHGHATAYREPLLDELKSGSLDGYTYREIEQDFPEEWGNREKDKLRYQYPEGESYIDCSTRVSPVLAAIEKHYHESEDDDNPLLIVSHQAVLRCVLGYLLDKPLEAVPHLKIPQHTVIRVTYEDGENVIDLIRMPVDHIDQGVTQLDT